MGCCVSTTITFQDLDPERHRRAGSTGKVDVQRGREARNRRSPATALAGPSRPRRRARSPFPHGRLSAASSSGSQRKGGSPYHTSPASSTTTSSSSSLHDLGNRYRNLRDRRSTRPGVQEDAAALRPHEETRQTNRRRRHEKHGDDINNKEETGTEKLPSGAVALPGEPTTGTNGPLTATAEEGHVYAAPNGPENHHHHHHPGQVDIPGAAAAAHGTGHAGIAGETTTGPGDSGGGPPHHSQGHVPGGEHVTEHIEGGGDGSAATPEGGSDHGSDIGDSTGAGGGGGGGGGNGGGNGGGSGDQGGPGGGRGGGDGGAGSAPGSGSAGNAQGGGHDAQSGGDASGAQGGGDASGAHGGGSSHPGGAHDAHGAGGAGGASSTHGADSGQSGANGASGIPNSGRPSELLHNVAGTMSHADSTPPPAGTPSHEALARQASLSDTNDDISDPGELHAVQFVGLSDPSSSASSSSSSSSSSFAALSLNSTQSAPAAVQHAAPFGGTNDDHHTGSSASTSSYYTNSVNELRALEPLPDLLRGSAVYILRRAIKLQQQSDTITSEDLYKIQRMFSSGLALVESGDQVIGLVLRCHAHYAHGKLFADPRYPDADVDVSIDMYTKAINVIDESKHAPQVPVLYGCVKHDLAVALLHRQVDEEARTESVERAIASLVDALRLNSLAASPKLWRKLNSVLSEAYMLLAMSVRPSVDPRLCLHDAYKHAHSICLVRTISKHPVEWASNLHKMALIILNYLDLFSEEHELPIQGGEHETKKKPLAAHVTALQNHSHHSAFSYAKAVELLRRALTVPKLRPKTDTQGRYRDLWCNLNITIARAYMGSARASHDASDARAAVRHIGRQALSVVTFTSNPVLWSRARRALAEAEHLLSMITPSSHIASGTVRSASPHVVYTPSLAASTKPQSLERISKTSTAAPHPSGAHFPISPCAPHGGVCKDKKDKPVPSANILQDQSSIMGTYVHAHSP